MALFLQMGFKLIQPRSTMKTKVFATVLFLSATASSFAIPVTFDLRDVSATAEIESGVITRNGIKATLTALVTGSSGVLNQTAGGFGVDASASGDQTSQLDGVNGAESISIVFDTDVSFTRLVVSSFGTGDSGVLTIGGFPSLSITTSGTSNFAANNFVTAGQSVVIKWSAGNGFSFDSFTVDTVTTSVPDSLPLGIEAAVLLLLMALRHAWGCRVSRVVPVRTKRRCRN